MENPKISICKKEKGVSVGCFDGFDCIRDFVFYKKELEGIRDAETFFRNQGIKKEDIEIVRPRIDKMTLKYG